MTNERQERLQNRLQPEIAEFRNECRTVVLATVDADGMPNVSYAPFVQLADGYYVLISEIARHARNLQQVPRTSLMMIEDESQSRQLFARKRLTFDARVEKVARDTASWQEAVAALEARHGDIVANLSQMADFILFRMVPEQGLYVKGFGQAFQVSSDDLVDVVHLQEGHKTVSGEAVKA
ncbi:heme utilization protein HutZ [Plesiomonas shigelloides]|uniref:heme utilization protein HutZ n=1 Tax=Plesiomonas shigelloides TaxID=703 RepID=UPI0030C07A21